MATYSLGLLTTITTTNSPAMDFKAGSGNRPRLIEFGVIAGVSTVCHYGLGRSANTPTQTGTTLVQADDYAGPAGLTTAAVTWSTAPTIPSPFLRLFATFSAIGAGAILTFPRGMPFPITGPSLVLWNRATNVAILNVWVIVDE